MSMTASPESSALPTQETTSPSQVKIQIQRFYVKEQFCKVPQGAAVFQAEGKPENALELNISTQMTQANVYEITLILHVTQKINQRTAVTLEVQQAGLFQLEQANEKTLGYLLNAYCPNLLYPYACKVVSDLSVAASLPPILLTPINFESMYQQRQQETAGTTVRSTGTTGKHQVEETVN